MLSLLRIRELGVSRGSVSLERAQVTRETYCVGTGARTVVVSSPATTIDMDSAENRYVLAGCVSGGVDCIDVSSVGGDGDPTVVFSTKDDASVLHGSMVTSARWHPSDSGAFFTTSLDGLLRVWDTNELVPVANVPLNGPVHCGEVSTCGDSRTLVAVGGDFTGGTRICDMRSCVASHSLSGHSGMVLSVCWNPWNQWEIVTASADGCAFVWDIRRSGAIGEVGFGAVTMESRKSAAMRYRGRTPIRSVRFSPDGHHIFTSDTRGNLRKYDSFTLADTLVHFALVPPSQDDFGDGGTGIRRTCLQFAISGNGEIVYHPFKRGIRCFKSSTGEDLGLLSGHIENVRCCYFNNALLTLVSGADDSHVIEWNSDTR